MEENRISTGIDGLDRMLGGGIPANRHIALCGGPGCGKTLFGFEYVYKGAKKGESSLLLSLQESEDSIIRNSKAAFKEWTDIDQLIEDGKLHVVKPEKIKVEIIGQILTKYVTQHNVKRITIDSANLLKSAFESDFEYRLTIQEFLTFLSNLNCTIILNYEIPSFERSNLSFDIEQFVADGIINLYNLERNEKRVRALEILKMRGTYYIEEVVPFKITSDGIEVFVGEKVY